MYKVCLALVLSIFTFGLSASGQIFAQSSCTGPLYCAGPCNVLSDSCSCISQLCATASGGTSAGLGVCQATAPGVGTCRYMTDSAYCDGSCLACTTEDDTFTCPGWINPCVNYCNVPGGPAEPTPDPDGQMAQLAAAHGKGMIGA